jgi:hypothetical protein
MRERSLRLIPRLVGHRPLDLGKTVITMPMIGGHQFPNAFHSFPFRFMPANSPATTAIVN